MNHVFLAATLPFTLAALFYLLRGGRAPLWLLVATPLAMALCALWAVLPDVPRLLGWHDWYMQLSRDPRTDLFLWHYTLDQVESESRWYAVGFFLMIGGLLAAALRELSLAERSS